MCYIYHPIVKVIPTVTTKDILFARTVTVTSGKELDRNRDA